MPSHSSGKSEIVRRIRIRYRRFRQWTKTDEFVRLIAKIMAIFIIGIMVLSAFVVMLR